MEYKVASKGLPRCTWKSHNDIFENSRNMILT